MLLQLLQSEPTAARRRIPFYLVDDSDGKTPETGQTPLGAAELQISKNGGAFANFAGVWSEVAAGLYSYEATAAELDTFGPVVFKLVRSGVRTAIMECQVVSNNPYGNRAVTVASGGIVSASYAAGAINNAAINADARAGIADAVWDELVTGHAIAGSFGELFSVYKRSTVSASGSNTALTFLTALTEVATDYWRDALIVFVSGALAGQVKKISGYNGSTKFITVSSAFTAAPSASDPFIIVNI